MTAQEIIPGVPNTPEYIVGPQHSKSAEGTPERHEPGQPLKTSPEVQRAPTGAAQIAAGVETAATPAAVAPVEQANLDHGPLEQVLNGGQVPELQTLNEIEDVIHKGGAAAANRAIFPE